MKKVKNILSFFMMLTLFLTLVAVPCFAGKQNKRNYEYEIEEVRAQLALSRPKHQRISTVSGPLLFYDDEVECVFMEMSAILNGNQESNCWCGTKYLKSDLKRVKNRFNRDDRFKTEVLKKTNYKRYEIDAFLTKLIFFNGMKR